MTSPFIPNSFTYGDAPAGGAVMPMVIAGRNPSNSIDTQYEAGYLWLSSYHLGGSGLLYYQAGNTSGSPNWTVSSAAAGALNTLSNGVTTVPPSGGNIALEGTTSQIIVTSDVPASNLTFSLSSSLIAPGTFTSSLLLTANNGLTVAAGGAAITGNSTITGDLAVSGALTAGSITFTGLSVDGTVSINTTGAGTTTIGNASAGAITIDVGTGDLQINGGGNEIHIGDDAAANTIVIGNDTALTSVHIESGTGDILIDGSVLAKITLGDIAQTGLIAIGVSTAGENVSINDVAPAASRTTTIGGGTVVTAAVTDTIDIGPDGATTNANSIKTVNINTGTVATGQVLTNIASGTVTSGTHTTSIATGNRAAGTMAVNLLTGTGTKTLNIGNADGLTTTNLLGPFNLNVNQNNNVAINSGTSTGSITIGNTSAGAVILNSASTIAIGDASAGAVTIDSGAGFSIDGVAASNVTTTGAGIDLTLSSSGGSVLVESTEDAALAIRLHANGGTSETIQIHSDQGTGVGSINLLSDVGGITLRATGLASADAINLEAPAGGIDIDGALQVNIASSQAAGTAVVITASNAAGGIDLTTGGGSIDLSSTGLVSVAANTASVASPTATSTQNFNVGSATFTGFTTASAAAQVFTITNSLVTTASVLLVTVCNEGANDAQMTVTRVKRIAGSFEVTCTNNGAAALNGNVSVNWWLLQA